VRTDFAVQAASDGSVDTHDLERAHDLLRRVYGATSMLAEADPSRPFRFRRTVLGEDRFALGRFLYSGSLELTSSPLPFFVVGQLHGGRLDLEGGGYRHRAEVRTPFVFPAYATHRVRLADLDLGQVMLDRTATDAELQSLGALPARTPLRFRELTPVSTAAVRHWQSLSSHVYRDVIGNDEAMASALVRGSVFRMLVTALVETFPSNVAPVADEPGRVPLPQTVRRALSYIEEHAAEDVGVAEIADAARLTPRGLQLAFRRHLDTTPLAALRAERLRRAHDDLRTGSPAQGDTVVAIAARWGFAHQGRFAAAYQEAYGRSPRTTLES